jgi:DNA-binding transcriptional LysR family regulator
MIFAPGLDYLNEVLPGIRASIKSSSVFNHLAAVRNHLGIAVLPHYIASKYPELRIVLPDEITLNRSYWLTCHRDVRTMRRERAVIAFLTDSLRARGSELVRPA